MSPNLGTMVLCSRCPVGPSFQSPWSSVLEAPEMSLVCVMCCNWVLITNGPLMHRISPRLSVCESQSWHASCCAGADHMKLNLPQQCLVSAKNSLWTCCLWSLLDPALMLSKTYHWVGWFWASWEGFWGRPIKDTACEWPLATCLELQPIHSL